MAVAQLKHVVQKHESGIGKQCWAIWIIGSDNTDGQKWWTLYGATQKQSLALSLNNWSDEYTMKDIPFKASQLHGHIAFNESASSQKHQFLVSH